MELDSLRTELRETRDMAVQAISVVTAHIGECNRRYEESVRAQASFATQYQNDVNSLHVRISTVVKGQRNVMLAIGGWIISSLILAIGYIAYNGFPWSH